jgi:hypothetical protein
MRAASPITEFQFPGTREPVWAVVFVAVAGFVVAGVVCDTSFLAAALMILVGLGPAAAVSLFGSERVTMDAEAVTLEFRLFSRSVWSESIQVGEIERVYSDYYGVRHTLRLITPRYWMRWYTPFRAGPIVIETPRQIYAVGRGLENDPDEIDRATTAISRTLQGL